MKRKLRIAVNAQIPSDSGSGGIETVLRVLTSLNRLGGEEEYVFIGHWLDAGWLESLLGERQILVRAPRPPQPPAGNFKRLLKPLLPLARKIRDKIKPLPPGTFGLPVSDGFIESLDCDVIHFPYQDFIVSKVPSIYNPHDLQHLHFPQFFPPEEIERREIVYPAACRASRSIVTASQFVKDDIVEKYQIEAEKIQVIPWSPPKIKSDKFSAREADSLFEKYQLPARIFALYPAMTWEHKNHLRLLEAVALLRDRDKIKINLVCTGYKNSFYPRIERRLRELNLQKQIKFTGIVTTDELSLLYRQAQFVIIPTLFEAASGPLFEAWQHNVPVACSAVTSLPEQAAGAAHFFDPMRVEEIAGALKRLSSDETGRDNLRARGVERLKEFKFELTAKAYRAIYRKTAGLILSDEDESLLNHNWTTVNH